MLEGFIQRRLNVLPPTAPQSGREIGHHLRDLFRSGCAARPGTGAAARFRAVGILVPASRVKHRGSSLTRRPATRKGMRRSGTYRLSGCPSTLSRVTRTAIGTDDSDDGSSIDPLSELGRRRYEEDQARRAVLREARRITRDAVAPERIPLPDPRSLPKRERRRVDRERR